MALKQMGIARMGPYRPKFEGAQQGGKTGRPKLLHNGTGHGLTGGGGLNAKGTGGGIKVSQEMKPMQRQLRKSKYQSNKFNAKKIHEREKNRAKRADAKTRTVGGTRMNPHPTGAFMYGHNQWGYINPRGMVDWTYQQPKKGVPVIGFQQALPWLQRTPHMRQVAQQYLSKRAAPPAWYIDPLYARQMAQHQLDRDTSLNDILTQRKQIEFDYGNSMEDLQGDYEDNRHGALINAANSGLASSAAAKTPLAEIARDLLDAKDRNQRQYDLQLGVNGELTRNEALINTGFSAAKEAEEGVAKERWEATHQGQKPPKVMKNTRGTLGGYNVRYNQHGVPMTVQPPAKPKFKSFKSWKNAQGQIVHRKP